MDTERSTNQQVIKLPLNITTATVFMALVAAAYHMGYWGAFRVSALQFMSISDFTRLAIWPFLSLTVMFVVGMVTGIVNDFKNKNDEPVRKKNPSFVGKYAFALAVIAMTLIMVYENDTMFWVYLSMFLALFVQRNTVEHVEICGVPENAQGGVLYVALLLIFITWGTARREATNIMLGSSYNRAILQKEDLSLENIGANDELRFLTNTESHAIFLVNSGPSILVLPREEISGILLKPIYRQRTYQPVKTWIKSKLNRNSK